MPDPLIENIIGVLSARLTAGPTGGYVGWSIRVVRDDFDNDYVPGDGDCAIVTGDPVEVEEEGYSSGGQPTQAYELPITLLLLIAPESPSYSPSKTANIRAAEVWSAVAKPQSMTGKGWEVFNNYAYNAKIGPQEQVNYDDFFSVNIPLTIRYRHKADDPYTAA